MDPITAFQVAGTVITFVDFLRNLLTEAREVYTSPSGTTSKSVRLKSIADDLSSVGDQVSLALAKTASTSRVASDDTLARLCRQCSSVQNDVQDALNKLQAQGNTKLDYAISSFGTAFKGIWSQGKIKDLDQRLKQIHTEMTMALLVSLWEEEKVHGKPRREFLEERMKEVEAVVRTTDKKVDQLTNDLIQITSGNNSEAVNKRNSLFQELWNMNWKPDKEKAPVAEPSTSVDGTTNEAFMQQHIIQSLWFSSIDARDKSIPEAYKTTFDWIFHDDSETKFLDWLRGSTSPLYWITGKAGSGKSTLMKYIVHHPSTMEHLQNWSCDIPLLFIHFYFWEASPVTLQQSREGLLRTLLWQSLRARPDLTAKVTPRRWEAYNALRGWEATPPTWLWDELQEAFHNLAALNGDAFKLVMFIDGLDEFGGKPAILIDWVKEAVSEHAIKVCVGSRPLTDFSDAFHQYPTLTMQFLTAPDIAAYVDGKFGSSPAFREWRELAPAKTEKLRRDLSEKAEGVFLWVYVVVRDLMTAMADGETLHELHQILESLPMDIMELYSKIYARLRPKETQMAARYFSIKFASMAQLYPLTLWLTEEATPPSSDSAESQEAMKRILGRRLNRSTRGIIVLSKHGVVEYHHRSARDWFQLPHVSSVLTACLPNDFDASLVLLDAFTQKLQDETLMRLANYPLDKSGFWQLTIICLSYASRVVASASITPLLIQRMELLRQVLDDRAKLLNMWGTKRRKELAVRGKAKTTLVIRDSLRFINPLNRRDTRDIQSSSTAETVFDVGYWSLCQDEFPIDTEDCFVGMAAQFLVAPYVMAKLKETENYAKQNGHRRSLLHNAIFGWGIYSYPALDAFFGEWHFPTMYRQRIELVSAILEAGASPREYMHLPLIRTRMSASEDRSYTGAISCLTNKQRDAVGPVEYWNEIRTLLGRRRRSYFSSLER